MIGARSTGRPEQGVVEPDVIARPEVLELEVRWLGGACDGHPIFRLTGRADDLRLVFQPSPPKLSLAPVSCPAVGLPFAVTFSMSVPVSQEDVALDVI